MAHKGWSNFETWSVNLWMDRDESVHAARRALLDALERPVTAADVRAFFLREMQGTTPDLERLRRQGERPGEIGFDEIAAQWEEERRFRRGLLGL